MFSNYREINTKHLLALHTASKQKYCCFLLLGASEAVRLTSSKCCTKPAVNAISAWVVYFVVLVVHFVVILSYEFKYLDIEIFFHEIANILAYTSISW